MARRPRHVLPGQAMHLIQRGNNRQAIFFADADYHFDYEALEDAAIRYGCAVHAYVFMTNHVHLLMTPSTRDGPSRVMQSVGRRYVRHVNATHQRTGTLWEGRFRSAIVDSERYLLTCSRCMACIKGSDRIVRSARMFTAVCFTVLWVRARWKRFASPPQSATRM